MAEMGCRIMEYEVGDTVMLVRGNELILGAIMSVGELENLNKPPSVWYNLHEFNQTRIKGYCIGIWDYQTFTERNVWEWNDLLDQNKFKESYGFNV